MDKDWLTFSRPSTEYREGAQKFVQVAKEYGGNRDKIICPCIICQNQCFQLPKIVYEHLIMNGIDPSYTTWVFHGEQEPILQQHDYANVTETYQMYRDVLAEDDGTGKANLLIGDENFKQKVEEAEAPLYEGCTKYTKLSATDDIKLANEMPTTYNGSIKEDALSQALGPEHRGRLRGGGYGVTPSRYDAQTYASMSNRELRDRLQNVEGKLREVFDLVLAKQQNEGNGKETNTNDAIQVSTNRPQSQGGSIDLQRTKNGVKQVTNSSYQVSRSSPQIQCDRRSAREVDDASRQASKASSQKSSPNIQRDIIKGKEGSKATSQLQPVGILRGSSCKLLNWLGNGQVVATGEIESTNPEAKVHHMVLGPDCWKVWVTVVRVENISLYRPTSEFRVLEDAISSTIAWPSKYVQVGE
ncbi:hypothetical protein COP1_011799 [Malus domestica]